MRVLDGIVEDGAHVRLLAPGDLASGQRVIVAVLDDGGERRLAQLEGCVSYSGPPVSIEAMNAAIAAESAGK